MGGITANVNDGAVIVARLGAEGCGEHVGMGGVLELRTPRDQ